jgi:hypothetical protein
VTRDAWEWPRYIGADIAPDEPDEWPDPWPDDWPPRDYADGLVEWYVRSARRRHLAAGLDPMVDALPEWRDALRWAYRRLFIRALRITLAANDDPA